MIWSSVYDMRVTQAWLCEDYIPWSHEWEDARWSSMGRSKPGGGGGRLTTAGLGSSCCAPLPVPLQTLQVLAPFCGVFCCVLGPCSEMSSLVTHVTQLDAVVRNCSALVTCKICCSYLSARLKAWQHTSAIGNTNDA